MNKAQENASLIRAPVAVILAWLIPGLGHIYLGHKVRGIVFLVAITVTFWTGVAIGGVKSVHPYKPVQGAADSTSASHSRSWWFFAQVLNGAYAITSYTVGEQSASARYLSWPSGDVAGVYSGVAGLLNLLVIIDALSRAEGVPQRSSSSSRRRKTPPGSGGRPRG